MSDTFNLFITPLKRHLELLRSYYHIAETFEGENFHELVKNRIFAEKPFVDCSLVSPAKDTTPPNFAEKTFTNSYKTSKFAQVFSLKSFLLYGTFMFTDM